MLHMVMKWSDHDQLIFIYSNFSLFIEAIQKLCKLQALKTQ